MSLRLPVAGMDTGRQPGVSGAATAEFALVAGVLALLTFAVVELGLILNARLVLAQAARTGLRQAIVDGGESERALRLIGDQLRAGGLDPAATTVVITPRTAHYGTVIRVGLTHSYRVRTPLLRWLGLGEIRLAATLLGRSEFLGGAAP